MLDLNWFLLLLFAGCRMAGVIFMNPIFGRRAIPAMVKVGLAMGIALFAVYDLQDVSVIDYTGIDMMIAMVKEFAVGFVLGFVMSMFTAVFHIGGFIMDMQMGLSMATMYDPASGSQISISGNLMTNIFTILFFATNSHMHLMAIAIKSYEVVPVGLSGLNGEIGVHILELFGYIWIYAVQLALPWIITQLIVESAVGILMKVVPNINIFVLNIQIKMIAGIVVLVTIIPVLTQYMTKVNAVMLEQMQEALLHLI